MKNRLILIVTATALMLGSFVHAKHADPTAAVNEVLSTMTDADKEFFNTILIKLMTSEKDGIDLSDEQSQFIGTVINKTTDATATGEVSDALHGISSKAFEVLKTNKSALAIDINGHATDYFLEDLGEKLKGVWDVVKGVGGTAWDAIKGLGSAAKDKLEESGVTNEIIKKIPADIVRRGLEAIVGFAQQKGWIGKAS